MRLELLLTDDTKKLTLNYAHQLTRMESLNPIKSLQIEGRYKFLCMGSEDHISAVTLAAAGLGAFGESLLKKAPAEVIDTIAIHECVHLRLGSGIKKGFLKEHKDIDELFHDVLDTIWLKSHLKAYIDSKFIGDKKWRSLYNGWTGALSTDREKAIDAVNNYFLYVKQDRIACTTLSIFYIPVPEALSSLFNVPLQQLFDYDPIRFLLLTLTGYELLERFEDDYRDTLASQLKAPIGDLAGC
jgi:hypothetical protein